MKFEDLLLNEDLLFGINWIDLMVRKVVEIIVKIIISFELDIIGEK